MRLKITMKYILPSSLLLYEILQREPSVVICDGNESYSVRKKLFCKASMVIGYFHIALQQIIVKKVPVKFPSLLGFVLW